MAIGQAPFPRSKVAGQGGSPAAISLESLTCQPSPSASHSVWAARWSPSSWPMPTTLQHDEVLALKPASPGFHPWQPGQSDCPVGTLRHFLIRSRLPHLSPPSGSSRRVGCFFPEKTGRDTCRIKVVKKMSARHFLSLMDYRPQELGGLIRRAIELKDLPPRNWAG